MTIASLLLIYFCLYSVALIHAYLRARTGHAPKARNAVAAMCIGAVGTLLIYALSLLEPAGTVPLVLAAAVALIPAFLLGLGCLVGIGIATWRPQPLIQAGLGALALGLPLLFILTMDANPAWSKTAEHKDNGPLAAEFQRLSLKSRLGRYPIVLPTTPQIDASFSCFAGGGAEIEQCHVDFATADEIRGVPTEVPIFHEINVARKASECVDPCLTFDEISQWCQNRNDVTFTEWCRTEPAPQITFSYDENRAPEDAASEQWRVLAGSFGATDVACLNGEPHAGCRARYDIARNLEVTIWLDKVDEDALAPRLSAAQDYALRIWETLKAKQ